MRTSIAVVVLLAWALLAGCEGAPAPSATTTGGPQQLALRTQPPPGPNAACMDALATGRLDLDPRSGLGLLHADGGRTPVAWPFGYSAWLIDGLPTLVDDVGRPIARAGDEIELGGGGVDGVWYACGDGLTVIAQ